MNNSEPTLTAGEDSTFIHACRASFGEAPAPLAEVARGDLLAQLLRKPELVRDRSFVIQAAVSEYETLCLADRSLTAESYCSRFAAMDSALRSSIFRQLEVEQFVNRNAWLKDKLQHQPWPAIGERRGSFVFLEELGRGALSRVYLCSQPDVGNRQVVVKLSSSSLGEANSLGRLRHRNIVPVLSVESDAHSGMSMLCMPFLGRSTLFDFFDQLRGEEKLGWKALIAGARAWEQPSDQVDAPREYAEAPPTEAAYYVIAWLGAKLADGLAHAHRMGIFHGDVKPSNILLTRDGIPLLMDFNLSGDIARSVTANGGTLPYMPPEQVRSIALGVQLAGRYDERSDIYSLGVVLYEALTGRLPFVMPDSVRPLASLGAEMIELQQRGPAPIPLLNPKVPRRLADLIHQCLEFHPDNRPQTASALAARLRAECGPWARFAWNCRRRQRRLYAAAAIVAGICMLSGVALAQRPPRHERLLADALILRAAGDAYNAEHRLEEALHERPTYADAQFELARTALLRKSWLKSNEEFYKLEQLQPSARSAAYAAYCFNCQGRHAAAIPWYLLAIERGGDVPEVLNNLCYSYEFGKSTMLPREERAVCHDYLAKALQMAPSLPSVQLNWIRLATRRFQEDGISMPENIPQVCRELVAARPDSGYVYHCVATAFAILAADDPKLTQEGLDYLVRAIERGHGPDERMLDLWSPFQSDNLLTQIAKHAPADDQPTKSGFGISHIVEPFSLARVK